MKSLKNLPRPIRRLGFTLIEMIGVLAIIAILVAAVAPRIFDAIADSKITSAISSIKTLQTAVAKYYADVGTLYPLNAAGVSTAAPNGTTGVAGAAYATSLPNALALPASAIPANTGLLLWRRFRGPYTDAFTTAIIPIGTTMSVSAMAAVAGPPTVNNASFALDGANAITTGAQLVFVTYTGISQREFEKIDGILDDGIGNNVLTRATLGKVKWNAATTTLYVYIAHN